MESTRWLDKDPGKDQSYLDTPSHRAWAFIIHDYAPKWHTVIPAHEVKKAQQICPGCQLCSWVAERTLGHITRGTKPGRSWKIDHVGSLPSTQVLLEYWWVLLSIDDNRQLFRVQYFHPCTQSIQFKGFRCTVLCCYLFVFPKHSQSDDSATL